MKRKRDDKRKDDNGPPLKKQKLRDILHCPITLDMFVNPVTLLCGHTIEYSSAKALEGCPLCRENITFLPKVNRKLIEIIDDAFPEYRNEERKYKIPPSKKNFGIEALKQIEVNKGIVFQEYLEILKRDFLDHAISRGRRSGKTGKVWGFTKAKSEGHLAEFVSFLSSNNINVTIDFDRWKDKITAATWNFVNK